MQLDASARLDSLGILTFGHGQGRESCQDQVAALGARSNKWRGEGEDLLRRQWRVESLGDSDHLGDGSREGLVASLDGEDGAGGGEDVGVGDELGGAEVGGYTDVLEHCRGGEHTRGVGEAEVVLAGLDGAGASLGEGALKEHDVLFLGLADALEVVYLLGCEAESLEVGGGELGEAFAVEGLFEKLEGECAVLGELCQLGLIWGEKMVGWGLLSYNCKISGSERPAAAARAFCLFINSWIFNWFLVNLGTAGAAEAITASPATTAPRVFIIEGILNVCCCLFAD